MALDCLHEPPAVALLRTFGASLAILGAVAAWLLKSAVEWASACDLAPKNPGNPDMGSPSANPIAPAR